MALEHAVEHHRRRRTARPRGGGRSCPCRGRSRRRRASRRAPGGRCSCTPGRAAAGAPPTWSTTGSPAVGDAWPRSGRGRRGRASGRPARGAGSTRRRARARGDVVDLGHRGVDVVEGGGADADHARSSPAQNSAIARLWARAAPAATSAASSGVEHDAGAERGEHELALEAEQVEGLAALVRVERAERLVALGARRCSRSPRATSSSTRSASCPRALAVRWPGRSRELAAGVEVDRRDAVAHARDRRGRSRKSGSSITWLSASSMTRPSAYVIARCTPGASGQTTVERRPRRSPVLVAAGHVGVGRAVASSAADHAVDLLRVVDRLGRRATVPRLGDRQLRAATPRTRAR